MNEMLNLISKRNSNRSFEDKLVPREDIDMILEASSNAPSGANMQPFNIYSVSGNKLNKLTNMILEHIGNGGSQSPDIQYYPIQWTSDSKRRRMKTGLDLYNLLKIERRDKEARKEQWFDNFRWFGARNVFFVTIDKKLITDSQGLLIDSGILLQTLILGIESLGYKSCPQGATTEYAEVLKKELNIPNEEALLFSLVFGFPTNDIINTYSPTKISYKETTTHIE